MTKVIPGTFTAPTVINSSEGEFIQYADFNEVIEAHNHQWARTGTRLFSFVWEPLFETTTTGTLTNSSGSDNAQHASGLFSLFKPTRPTESSTKLYEKTVFAMLYNMEVVIDLYGSSDLSTIYDTITLTHTSASWSLESQAWDEDITAEDEYVATIRRFNSGSGTGYCAFVDGWESVITSTSKLPNGR